MNSGQRTVRERTKPKRAAKPNTKPEKEEKCENNETTRHTRLCMHHNTPPQLCEKDDEGKGKEEYRGKEEERSRAAQVRREGRELRMRVRTR